VKIIKRIEAFFHPNKPLLFEDVFEKIKIYRPQDGDIILLKTPHELTCEQVKYLKEQWDSFWKGSNIKVVVLEGGLDIGIARKEE